MKTSIIICSRNNEQSVYTTVAACCKHNPESEVIVVDNASTDKTEILLKELSGYYKFEFLKLQENEGTGNAMALGAEYATSDLVLFINANVEGLRKEHFKKMIDPFQNAEVDLVYGTLPETLIDYRVNPFQIFTGCRAMLKQDLLPLLNDFREIRFGLDYYINLYFQSKGKRLKMISLDGLKQTYEKEKSASNNTKDQDREMAFAILNNLDLITKRIQNKIQDKKGYSDFSITSAQHQLNNKMQSIIEKEYERLFR